MVAKQLLNIIFFPFGGLMELFKFLQLINKENNIGKVREIFSFISCLAL